MPMFFLFVHSLSAPALFGDDHASLQRSSRGRDVFPFDLCCRRPIDDIVPERSHGEALRRSAPQLKCSRDHGGHNGSGKGRADPIGPAVGIGRGIGSLLIRYGERRVVQLRIDADESIDLVCVYFRHPVLFVVITFPGDFSSIGCYPFFARITTKRRRLLLLIYSPHRHNIIDALIGESGRVESPGMRLPLLLAVIALIAGSSNKHNSERGETPDHLPQSGTYQSGIKAAVLDILVARNHQAQINYHVLIVQIPSCSYALQYTLELLDESLRGSCSHIIEYANTLYSRIRSDIAYNTGHKEAMIGHLESHRTSVKVFASLWPLWIREIDNIWQVRMSERHVVHNI